MEAMLAAASSTPATALAPSTSPTITSQRVIVLSLPVLAALRIRQGPCPSPDPRLRPCSHPCTRHVFAPGGTSYRVPPTGSPAGPRLDAVARFDPCPSTPTTIPPLRT